MPTRCPPPRLILNTKLIVLLVGGSSFESFTLSYHSDLLRAYYKPALRYLNIRLCPVLIYLSACFSVFVSLLIFTKIFKFLRISSNFYNFLRTNHFYEFLWLSKNFFIHPFRLPVRISIYPLSVYSSISLPG